MSEDNNRITIEQSFLNERGFKYDKDIVKSFPKRNFIIGPNGGGKTRLLKAVIEYYKKIDEDKNDVNKHEIIFVNFPELVGKTIDGKNPGNVHTESSLYDIFINNTPIDFENFLATIEKDIFSFIKKLSSAEVPPNAPDILSTQKVAEKINDMLEKFLKAIWGIPLRDVPDKEDIKKCKDEGLVEYYKKMSPGERNLLYISIFLAKFANDSKSEKLVLIIDEPELHLHYKVLRDFIETIEETFPQIPIWIASHSVHLLTRYKFDQITYVKKVIENGINENSIIERGTSNLRENIIKGVLGAEDSYEELLLDVKSWEYIDFVRECFEKPTSICTDSKDKQFQTFLRKLRGNIEENKLVRILDYGAGKGRFGTMLKETMQKEGWTNKQLEYYTFCLDEDCENVFGAEFDCGCDPKVFQNGFDRHFDIILLVNTLHEIDIIEWSSTFDTINMCLANDGYLFFCEARILTVGENPTAGHGYLVLCKESLKNLFEIEDSIIKENYNIIYVQIPKTKLKKLSDNAIISAIDTLKSNSFEMAKKLCDNESDKKSASRKRAFYLMQHLNAEKALDVMIKKCLESGDVLNFGKSEKKLIEKALSYFGHDANKVSKALNIDVSTFYNKIDEYKIYFETSGAY